MDSAESVNGYAPGISNNKPGIIERQSKTCISFDISSKKPDDLNLSCNKQDLVDLSSDNPDGKDASSIKPDICASYSKKSDRIDILRDCTEISISNGKVDTPDKLSDFQDMKDFPDGKLGNYVNSSNKSQEPDAPMKSTRSGVFSSDKPESCYFSTGKPGSCDFSWDKPWSENFPSSKSRSSAFFSENIWGSNYSSENPVSCAFPLDKPWSGDFSSDKPLSPALSGENIWGGTSFLTNNQEDCNFSGDMPWIANFSSDMSEIRNVTSVMLASLELLNKKPDDSEHSNSLLKNPETSRAMLETSKEVGFSSCPLNDKSCSAKKETEKSKSTNVSCAELDNVEVSNKYFENPKKSSKSFDRTESLVIETSVIPCYIVETSGVLGNDPSNCETEKELNNVNNFSRDNPECPDYESLKSFDDGSEVTIADGIWKKEKCRQSSTVCVLKRLDEDSQYKFKCIYFNKGTKLDELFKNRSYDELNVSQDEILECIDSMKGDQLNFIEDPIKSNNQAGFLEDRMTSSMEKINENSDIDNNVLIQNTTKEQIDFAVDKLLNEVFSAVDENEQQLYLTHLKTHDKEMVKNARFIEAESRIYDNQIYSIKLVENLNSENHNENIGSQVQDISGYSTDPQNDSITDITDHKNQMTNFSMQQRILNCVKIVWESIFSIVSNVFNSFFRKAKSLTSTERATVHAIPETVTNYEEFQSVTSTTNGPSTSCSSTRKDSRENMKIKTRITNFSTLFQHLSATVGTDMTAERAMKDINSQVVMDIYNGFHELRIVDYGSLDLMSKCIRGCIVTLQRTLTRSNPIVQKASILLRKKTHTLEEMRKLNEDLQDLTSDAESHLHSIDRALTGLEDFTDDFMYYKNAISKEMVEFLLEDFPEIFK